MMAAPLTGNLKLWTTYHLWDSWSIDGSTLVCDSPKETVTYTGISRVWRNKATAAALMKHENGTNQVILLDPELEQQPS